MYFIIRLAIGLLYGRWLNPIMFHPMVTKISPRVCAQPRSLRHACRPVPFSTFLSFSFRTGPVCTDRSTGLTESLAL